MPAASGLSQFGPGAGLSADGGSTQASVPRTGRGARCSGPSCQRKVETPTSRGPLSALCPLAAGPLLPLFESSISFLDHQTNYCL